MQRVQANVGEVGRDPGRSNQVWAMDFHHGQLYDGLELTPSLVQASGDFLGWLQLGRKGARRQVSKRGMRSLVVIVIPPIGDPLEGVVPDMARRGRPDLEDSASASEGLAAVLWSD